MQKQIIFWDAKKAAKRDAQGREIAKEFHGVFQTKVAEGTPGAVNYKGEMPAPSTVKWDYHAIEATVIRGRLRWIDKVLPPYDGARSQLVMFIESDKYLHRVSVKYDANNMRDVMNQLCGLGKAVSTEYLNLQYWVRPALDSNKKPKLTAKNEIRYAQTLQFVDVAPQFTYQQWMDFAQTNGLQWEQKTTASGAKEWSSDAELKYWDSRLVAMQQFLLKTETVLPFTYGSLTACESTNPSGGGNLTSHEIDECQRIYEAVKVNYKLPFAKEAVDADNIDFSAPPMAAKAVAEQVPETPQYADVPTQIPPPAGEYDDLPF